MSARNSTLGLLPSNDPRLAHLTKNKTYEFGHIPGESSDVEAQQPRMYLEPVTSKPRERPHIAQAQTPLSARHVILIVAVTALVVGAVVMAITLTVGRSSASEPASSSSGEQEAEKNQDATQSPGISSSTATPRSTTATSAKPTTSARSTTTGSATTTTTGSAGGGNACGNFRNASFETDDDWDTGFNGVFVLELAQNFKDIRVTFKFEHAVAVKLYEYTASRDSATGGAVVFPQTTSTSFEFQAKGSIASGKAYWPVEVRDLSPGYKLGRLIVFVEVDSGSDGCAQTWTPTTTTTTTTTPTPKPPTTPADEMKLVYYYENWGIYRAGCFKANMIKCSTLTHINYAFLYPFNEDGNIAMDISAPSLGTRFQVHPDYAPELTALKELKLRDGCGHLKLLFSIGGWTLSKYFSKIAAAEASRAKFAEDAVKWMIDQGFDGIDIDWEYPVAGGLPGNNYSPDDGSNYGLLLQAVRDEMDTKGVADKLLTIAAPGGPDKIANMDIGAIQDKVDWINIMAYDFFGPWAWGNNNLVGHNAPLFPDWDEAARHPENSLEYAAATSWNVDAAVQAYIKLGMPRKQLVVGMPTYTRAFANVQATDSDRRLYKRGSPSVIFTASAADPLLAFWDMTRAKTGLGSGFTEAWDDVAKVPYIYDNEGNFISYDDESSIAAKSQYVLDQGLAGAMVWALTWDKNNRRGSERTPDSEKECRVPPEPTSEHEAVLQDTIYRHLVSNNT